MTSLPRPPSSPPAVRRRPVAWGVALALLATAAGPQPGFAQAGGARAAGGFVTAPSAPAPASAPASAAAFPVAPPPPAVPQPLPPVPPTPPVVAGSAAPATRPASAGTPPAAAAASVAPTAAPPSPAPASVASPARDNRRERLPRAAAPAEPRRAAGAAVDAPSPAPAAPPGRCGEDEPVETAIGPSARGADASAPRSELKALLAQARERSQAVGAARLLADAAELDVEEARAGRKPSVTLSLNAGGVLSQQDGLPDASGAQARASVTVGAPLFDGGRIDAAITWRRHLAEAARQGRLTQEEQVALQTVQLALDRNRYRLQSQIYRQYARKMGCLVDALETIVSRDRGRASELVQAQKTLAQAELAREQAVASLRQVEIRLRRFVGDGLPPSDGAGSLLLALPPLEAVLAASDEAPEVAVLRAQANAQDAFGRVVETQGRPQVNWIVSGSGAAGAGNPRNVSAGLSVSVPLFTPTLEPATSAARKRAEAARLQVADALAERRTRVTEVHDQATTAFERARRTAEILRDSERVRQATLLQWQQLGRRSLFDVMGAEGEHYGLRVAYINALVDGQQAVAALSSLGGGVARPLE